jgi:hypothetical protein
MSPIADRSGVGKQLKRADLDGAFHRSGAALWRSELRPLPINVSPFNSFWLLKVVLEIPQPGDCGSRNNFLNCGAGCGRFYNHTVRYPSREFCVNT